MKLVNRRISFPQKGRDENADFAGRDDGAAAPARAGDDGGGGSGVCAVRAQRDAGAVPVLDAVAVAGEPMRTRHAARTADAAGLVRRFADGCAATGDAGQPSAPGTEGAGGLLRDDEPDVSAGDNRKLAEQPNRGGNCAAERAGGRLLRGAIGKTVDEGYIR